MRRRVLAAILGVTTLAVILFGIPLAVVIGRLLDESATVRVERQAVLAARSVPADFATGDDPVELAATADGVVFALYDTNGALVAGLGPAVADAVTTRALGNEVVDTEAGEARIVAVPISSDERVIGAIRAEQSTLDGDARAHRIFGWLLGLAMAVLGVGALVGWIVAGRLARPVRRLRDAAIQLGEGDFALDVPESDVSELDQAAEALTATARRLDALVTKERMFSSDVSHQLRTPIAGLRAVMETELAFPRADRNEVLHDALADLDRLERTVAELLAIARAPQATNRPFSVADVLSDLNRKWSGPFARAGRSLRVASARFTPLVEGSSMVLSHALDVLIDNALLHGAGEVEVDCRVGEDSVTIHVRDEGPGFESTTLEQAATDNGDVPPLGLGLPLAQRLVESMPGRLAVTRSGPRPQIDVVLQRADRPRAFVFEP